MVPPMIKNFVNCTFDSDLRSEYHGNSGDLIQYDTRREVAPMRTLQPYAEDDPVSRSRVYRKPARHSTTPL